MLYNTISIAHTHTHTDFDRNSINVNIYRFQIPIQAMHEYIHRMVGQSERKKGDPQEIETGNGINRYQEHKQGVCQFHAALSW